MNRKIIIGVIILILGIVFLTYRSCNKPIPVNLDNGWETFKKEKEKELLKRDSIYKELKKETDDKISKLEKKITEQEIKHQKQLKDLKKKYDKEYSKVTATSIDSSINISSRFLSEEINYSKFQKD